MADHTRNVIALVLVTAAHVAAVMLIKSPPRESEQQLEVFFVPLVIDATRRKQPPTTQAKSPDRESTGLSGDPETSNSHVDPNVAPAIDWYNEISMASGTVLNRQAQEDAMRPLISKPKALSPAPEVIEPGIFTLTPPHKPGTFENLGEGVTREWISDYCYWWTDMGPDGRVPRKKCLPKFANMGNGDLFKQFRPKYLDIKDGKLPPNEQDQPATVKGIDR